MRLVYPSKKYLKSYQEAYQEQYFDSIIIRQSDLKINFEQQTGFAIRRIYVIVDNKLKKGADSDKYRFQNGSGYNGESADIKEHDAKRLCKLSME